MIASAVGAQGAIKKQRRDYRDAFGHRLPSVTTILEGNLGWSARGLMYWAHGCGERGESIERARRDAMDGGTAAHELIDAEVTGRRANIPSNFPADLVDKGQRALDGFREWREQHEVILLASEEGMTHDALGFGGTIDQALVLDGEVTLSDLKTSKSIYPDVILQLAAYKILWDHLHPDQPIKQGLIMHAPEGNFRGVIVTLAQLEVAKVMFMNLLFIHKNKKHLAIDEEEEGGF